MPFQENISQRRTTREGFSPPAASGRSLITTLTHCMLAVCLLSPLISEQDAEGRLLNLMKLNAKQGLYRWWVTRTLEFFGA